MATPAIRESKMVASCVDQYKLLESLFQELKNPDFGVDLYESWTNDIQPECKRIQQEIANAASDSGVKRLIVQYHMMLTTTINDVLLTIRGREKAKELMNLAKRRERRQKIPVGQFCGK